HIIFINPTSTTYIYTLSLHDAIEVLRLLSLFPQRGRKLRQGHERDHPATPVPQGGAGPLRKTGERARRARGAGARRPGAAGEAGPSPPGRAPLHGRSGILVGEDVRPGGLASRPERLSRDQLVLDGRRLPGAARA